MIEFDYPKLKTEYKLELTVRNIAIDALKDLKEGGDLDPFYSYNYGLIEGMSEVYIAHRFDNLAKICEKYTSKLDKIQKRYEVNYDY